MKNINENNKNRIKAEKYKILKLNLFSKYF